MSNGTGDSLQAQDSRTEDQGFSSDQPEIKKVVFQPLTETALTDRKQGIAQEFHGVNLTISAELGRVMIKVRDLINLEKESVLKLNRVADEKVLILVNETPFAHGEIVVINDRFGVRVTSLVNDGDKGEPGQEKEGQI
jgi:flagellar motor switch protein FliN